MERRGRVQERVDALDRLVERARLQSSGPEQTTQVVSAVQRRTAGTQRERRLTASTSSTMTYSNLSRPYFSNRSTRYSPLS